MLKKLLKEVVTIVVGKQAEEIVDLLDGRKYVNEFIIAKKFDITINQMRNILYKISDKGLVSSIRKKDKKKGWYTYFWKIEVLKSLEFLKEVYLKHLEQVRNQIKSRETKRFYVCERCGIEFNEENAMLHDFTCNECGDVFTVRDNEKVLKELKKNEKRIEEKLKFIDDEIEIEKQKLEKERKKERRKEEKEKAAKKKASKKKEVKKKIVKKKTIKKKTPKKKSVKKKAIKKTKKKVAKKKTPKKK